VSDNRGHVTLSYVGKLRHLNVGWKYMGQTILLYIVNDYVDVVTPEGELVGEITLDPEKNYQPIPHNSRCTASAVRDDLTRHSGAGDGDRTRMASLEGWSSTIELHPRVSHETRRSLEHPVLGGITECHRLALESEFLKLMRRRAPR
jgi:hypothetical protein